MNVEELVRELAAQKAENQILRNKLAKALESLEQANARIKQLARTGGQRQPQQQ